MRRTRFEMCHFLFLVLAGISMLLDTANAVCTSSKQEDGFNERVVCSNVTLHTALMHGGRAVNDILIFQSAIESIPDQSFVRYSKSLTSLSVHDCGVREISDYAFAGLTKLRKLSLPHNAITVVRDQWFVALISLEQLDLSNNLIASIEPGVFEKLKGIKRLDLTHNNLTCLEPIQLAPMAGIEKLRFAGNPITFRCRGTLTLWLRDLGINYETEQRGEENWLDSILWLCAADDGRIADSEVLMKECVILNLFNQLRTALTTAESFPLPVSEECINARNELTKCVAGDRRRGKAVNNGHVVRKLLRQLKESKSTV
nr:PREDICTED: insulin-like growth factor-binding protein complex acid labile subunit [Linepithema humile]